MEFRNFLLAAVPPADMQFLSPLLAEVALNRGEVVLPEGAEVDYVYFPGSAVLSVVSAMRDGRYVESSTVGREGGAGLLEAACGRPSHHRVLTQIAGSAIRLPAKALRERIEQSQTFTRLLFGHAMVEANQTQQFAACNALHTAEQRLARWLLMTADRAGGQGFVLTQDDLANMTGVQRTTISALASEFKKRGLIRYSRGNLEILDQNGLGHVACECAEVAHELFLRRRDPA